MSTPNFCKKNAKNYYAVEIETDFDYDDLVYNLQAIFKDKTEKWDNNNRSYEGKIVSRINKTIGKWDLCFDIIIRNGYYSGVNLDWDLTITDKTDYTEYYFNDYDYKDLPRYIHDKIDKQIDKIEKVFSDLSTPLICAGIFSNGEAIYQKLSK